MYKLFSFDNFAVLSGYVIHVTRAYELHIIPVHSTRDGNELHHPVTDTIGSPYFRRLVYSTEAFVSTHGICYDDDMAESVIADIIVASCFAGLV